MTREEHRERHVLLHQHLDELLADYLEHHRNEQKYPSEMSLLELMVWSHQQTIEPAELKGRSGIPKG